MWNDLAQMYAALADGLSRTIFEKRLLFGLSGDLRHIDEMIMGLDNLQGGTFYGGLFDPAQKSADDAVMFCAGETGRRLASRMNRPPVFFCDNNPAKQGQVIDGIEVISPETLMTEHLDKVVVLGTVPFAAEIYDQLLKIGFPVDQIVGCFEEQYFEQFLPHRPGEIFIDGGAHDGGSSVDFIRWCGDDFERIELFEPDLQCMVRSQKKLGGYPGRVRFHSAGLWSRTARLSFQSTHDGSSTICENGPEQIEVVSLDEMLAGGPATFIKMDIEGAELEALRGAEKIIRQYHPKLAISIYHKPEDILELPRYILELNPDYKLYLRHYSLVDSETVLYAVAG